jgi:hypothetical protein
MRYINFIIEEITPPTIPKEQSDGKIEPGL